jgi:homoserine dehydrogenase
MASVDVPVALLGYGTVGSAVNRLLIEQADDIERATGHRLRVVKALVRNLDKEREWQPAEGVLTTDIADVVGDPSIAVVAEVMGGVDPAGEYVLECLRRGKHVVSANKQLVARRGAELFATATEAGVQLRFEASVCAAIPVIKVLRESLVVTNVHRVLGIVNGTTNFILTRMESGAGYGEALAEAQRLGYAEADPTFDIEGVDAAHKATVMSAIAFGIPMQFDKAHVEGIVGLQAADIRHAESLGYRIKLLGITRRRADLGGIELRVHPTLVPAKRLIANVEGAMNAVVVQADAVGTTLYYGKGAGAEPTASAVVADLVDITRLHTADPDHRVPHLAFRADALSDTPILPIADVVTSFYLRLCVADEAGVLSKITATLAEHDISIDAVLQRPSPDQKAGQQDLIILTHNTVEGRMREAIARMQALSTVLAPIVSLRKEDLA